MPPLKKVKRGEKITADSWNQLVDLISDMAAMVEGARGGVGIDVKVQPTGLIIAMVDALRDRAVWAKIVEAPTPDVPVLPSACTYTLRGIDQKFEMVDVIPDFGRPCHGDDVHIYPDLVGNMAIVLRNPQSDGSKLAQMYVLGEHAVRGGCT